MIDAILHVPATVALPASLIDEDGSPALSDPKATNAVGEQMHYVRMTPEQLEEWRPHVTVLAETPYTGTGTADRVYAQIQYDTDALALYESVYDTSPREVDDGEGGVTTYVPPFKFGMLAESELQPSKAYTYKTDIWQRCTDEEAEALDAALNAAPARQRRMWSDALSIEHSSEYYVVLRDQMVSYFGATRASEILAPSDEGGIYTALPEQDSGYVESSSGSGAIESDSGSGIIGN